MSDCSKEPDECKILQQFEPVKMTEAGPQLQKLTECCICLKTFTDPRMLPCIHTFCFGCLKQTADATKKKPGESLPCFLCRKMFTIPANGMDGLQKNFFIQHLLEVTANLKLRNMSAIACDMGLCKDLFEGVEKTKHATMHCIECKENFCEFCAKAHKLQKLSKDHHVVKIGSETDENIRRISPTRNCSDHNQKPLDYYCPQCKKIVCVSCVIENHGSHNCKDVSTVEEEFRQAIERNAFKISIYADEMIGKRNNVEKRKENILLKMAETESKIRQRNLDLKEMVDRDTSSLLTELFHIKQKQIKDCENEKEEIERNHTILKSFETYCTELRTKGSASEICSNVEKLSIRADELEKDHNAITDRPCQSTEISFKATVLEELLTTSNNNVVGRIQETGSQVQSFVLIVGLSDGSTITNDVCKVNLQCPNDISSQIQIPAVMRNGADAAVYREKMYVTGVGVNYDEIWKYDLALGWMKCKSLVQGRMSHSTAFVDEILYICGGSVASDKIVLDSVEGYNTVTNTCTTVGKLFHCIDGSGNCVPYKSSLYIFGGTDKDNKAVNHVQVYNTKQNTCTLLSKPMPTGYNLMRATLWNTSVILIGRHTCFIFNFETETWQEKKRFRTDVSHFGLALANDRIFVIGGGTTERNESGKVKWKCRDDVRYIPFKHIIDDKPFQWKNYAKLSKPALVQTYEKIKISCQKVELVGSGNELTG